MDRLPEVALPAQGPPGLDTADCRIPSLSAQWCLARAAGAGVSVGRWQMLRASGNCGVTQTSMFGRPAPCGEYNHHFFGEKTCARREFTT
jgi:hypothetical protein